jgi:alkyl hydroperoxide reductase subunit AhpC
MFRARIPGDHRTSSGHRAEKIVQDRRAGRAATTRYADIGLSAPRIIRQRQVWSGLFPPHAFPTDDREMRSRGTESAEETMTLQIGSTAPDFEAETTEGRIRFYDWMGNSWCVLFSHPKDFTPVCTTELGYMAKIKDEFDKRNVKIISLSVDPVDSHRRWHEDIRETQGHAPNYPMIGDPDLSIAKLWGMLPAETTGDASTRTPADNQTVRNVFVIGPDKKIKLILVYPMSTGRNFDEVLRVIDSLQMTAKHKVSTPANWQRGEDVIISGSVTDEEARQTYPQGWRSPKPYIRIVPQPGA